MRVKAITHVNLAVDDVEAARAFYGQVLGLEELVRAEGARRPGAWFRVGALELHLSHEDHPDNRGSDRHFAIEVDDLAATRAALQQARAPIDAGRPLGATERFFTRDPAGNRIEVQRRTDGDRLRVASGTPWEPLVGYSRLMRAGRHVYVTGTTATLPEGGHVGDGDAYAQARQALANIERALGQAGGRLEHVVRTRMFVTDIRRDWQAVGRAHAERFADIRPATTMVEVNRLIDDWMLVEVEADAVID